MNYQLVIRTCGCGCGRSFKILPESPCKYFSSACDPSYKPKPVDPQVVARVKRESKKIYGDSYGGYSEFDGKDDLTLPDIEKID
jgi:hypothetical protein